ncbi:uncharacterized protein LOC110038836, partial [Phalaenopsis equestris]|uniref:uncharacterized protein LOC110038836 n=1 Tax=Phalaenopsis equestris TaxID=78828 RepID=UPI0009E36E88
FDKGGPYITEIWRAKKGFRDEYIMKVVLTSAPPSGFAAVIYGCNLFKTHLALARVGDASWTPVQFDSKLQSVEDIFYHKEKDKLFVVTSLGSVFCSDLHIRDWSSEIKMLKLKSFASWSDRKPLLGCVGFNRHIIFSSGRLLQICRKVDAEEEEEEEEFVHVFVKAQTMGVRITMKQRDDGTSGWIPAKASDLDDQAIFIGCNHVFSVPAAGSSGLRKNSVYFTGTKRYCSNWNLQVRDAAVFDVETDAFQRFFSLDSQFNWPPLVWFMPSRLHFDVLS